MSRIALVGLVGLLITGGALFLLVNTKSAPLLEERLPEKEMAEDDPDVKLLTRMGFGTDDSSLIEFVKQRSPADIDPEKVEPWIQQLGSDNFQKREGAFRKLKAVGYGVLPLLVQAQNDPDAEIAQRATGVLKELGDPDYSTAPLAVIRLLAKNRPPEAVSVLLKYLPFAIGEIQVEELWYTINDLAVNADGIDPVLLSVLDDGHPARRALAACIIGRAGSREQRASVRSLLKDQDAMVRLRAAQGLLAGKDTSCIPTLIHLLNDPSVEISWQAEELLHWAAGENGCKETLGACGRRERQSCRKAWQEWWSHYSARLNLEELPSGGWHPGLVLVLEGSKNHQDRTNEELALYGCDGQRRWKIGDLPDASDVRLIKGNRVLLAEGRAIQKITVRRVNGVIEWQSKDLDTFLSFQVSPSGRVLVVSCRQGRFWEINLGRKTSTSPLEIVYPGGVGPVFRIGDDGKVLCFDVHQHKQNRTQAALFDVKTGDLLERIWLEAKFEFINDAELLSNGNLLVVHDDELAEFDKKGNKAWKLEDQSVRPRSAIRLRNGNTLLAGNLEGIGGLLEVTKTGGIAWEGITNTGPGLVRVCFPLIRFGFSAVPHSDPLRFRMAQLSSENEHIRERAIIQLMRECPTDAESISRIIRCFDDPSENVRYYVPRLLESVGPPTVPLLIRALKDKQEKVRAGAAYLLGRESLGHSQAVVSSLISAIEDESGTVREMAVNSIGEFGTRGKEAVPKLIEALNDRDGKVVRQAIYSLSEVGREDKGAISALIKTLSQGDADSQMAAVRALGTMHQSARSAVPWLVKILKEKEGAALKEEIIVALGEIGSAAGSAGAIVAQYAEDEALGPAALQALAKIDPGGKPTMQILIKALKAEKNGDRRNAALDALEKLGPAASPALPVLLQLQNDPEEDFLWQVRRTIRRIKKEF